MSVCVGLVCSPMSCVSVAFCCVGLCFRAWQSGSVFYKWSGSGEYRCVAGCVAKALGCVTH